MIAHLDLLVSGQSLPLLLLFIAGPENVGMYPVHRYGITADDRILPDHHPGRVAAEHLRPVDLAQRWVSPEYQFAGIEEVLQED